jgi:hypothetical protein
MNKPSLLLMLPLVAGVALAPLFTDTREPLPVPTDVGPYEQYSGTILSMAVLANGTIWDLYIRESRSGLTFNVKGCGARSADHPLLNWAFTERRLVHVYADADDCFGNVLIGR